MEADTSSAAVRQAYADHVRELDDDRKRLFGSLGVDEIRVSVGKDYVPALLAFFKRRGMAVA